MQRVALSVVAVLLFGFACCGPATARDMKLTIYDDGESCPGQCDAHVVINPSDNGTRFAFLPTSPRSQPQHCVAGQECRICFGEADATCMSAVYRGGGPPVGTFDFTPTFYNAHCGKPGIPVALERQCAAQDQAMEQMHYAKRINCFQDASHPRCHNRMTQAEAARQADLPKRSQCLAMGQKAFNAAQTVPRERRANSCNYTEQSLGKNSKGTTWRLLLPAACRAGTYVGSAGLDCCNASTRYAAANHGECSIYFPLP